MLRSHGPGQQLKAEEIELVAGPGETLVEMRLASVTQLDRTVLAGKQPQMQPPFIPGSEGAGVVVSSAVVRARDAGGGPRRGRRGDPARAVGPVRRGAGCAPCIGCRAVWSRPTALALLAPALTAHTAVRRVGQVVRARRSWSPGSPGWSGGCVQPWPGRPGRRR